MPFAKQVREKANARIAAAGVRVLFRSLSAFLLPLFLCPAQHKLCDLFTCQIRIRKIRDRGFCVHDQNAVCFKVKRHDPGQEQNQRRHGGKHALFAPGGLRLPCRYYFRGAGFPKSPAQPRRACRRFALPTVQRCSPGSCRSNPLWLPAHNPQRLFWRPGRADIPHRPEKSAFAHARMLWLLSSKRTVLFQQAL